MKSTVYGMLAVVLCVGLSACAHDHSGKSVWEATKDGTQKAAEGTTEVLRKGYNATSDAIQDAVE